MDTCLISALTGQVLSGRFHLSGNATNRDLSARVDESGGGAPFVKDLSGPVSWLLHARLHV